MPDEPLNHNTIDTARCTEIVNFLRDFDADGRHNLVAIHPDTRAVAGKTFSRGATDRAATWAKRMNGAGYNVYFTVNEPAPNAPDDKLRKEHISTVRAVFVDADPRKSEPFAIERQRILGLAEAAGRAVRCRPTHIVDSGGGVQLFWRLAEKLPAAEYAKWAEEQGRALAYATGGDAVQNIDRIMRLPGTINYPDAAKREHGRQPAPARALPFQPGAPYTPEQLSAYAPPRPAEDRHDNSEEIAAIQTAIDMRGVEHGPDDDLARRLGAAAARDTRLQALLRGDPLHGDDQTGSAYRAALVARICLAGGFTPTEYATIAHSLTHCRTKEDQPGGWARQYAREWCNIGVKHAVEHWFTPIQDADPNPFEIAAAIESVEREAQRDAARFPLLDMFDACDLALTQSTQPLVKGLLDQGAMTVLYGDSNVGKTFVALDLAYHVWAGLPYAGMKTVKKNVVYVAAEGGVGILKRMRALILDRKLERAPGFNVIRSSVDLLNPDADLPALLASIREACPDVGLIIVDTASRAMAGGDENSAADMTRFVKNLDVLRKAFGAHLMVIHHTGKDKAKGARGHSSLRAATDTEIEVGDGRIEVTKQRDLEKSFACGFELRSVQLGLDADGDVVTSAVVELRLGEDATTGRRDGVQGAGETVGGLHGLLLSTVGTLACTDPGRGAPLTAICDAMKGRRGGRYADWSEKRISNALSELVGMGHLVLKAPRIWGVAEAKITVISENGAEMGVFG